MSDTIGKQIVRKYMQLCGDVPGVPFHGYAREISKDIDAAIAAASEAAWRDGEAAGYEAGYHRE